MRTAATENLAALGNFGVSQAKLTLFKQRLKTYDGLRVMPRQAQGAAAKRQLEQLLPEADQMLANRMDRLAWQFRESEPEFYEKYQVARTVVNAATTGAEEVAVPTIVAAPVSTPITKAA